jgi:uncharacterized membrane protein YdjX (TVP38/TMEM64 family)
VFGRRGRAARRGVNELTGGSEVTSGAAPVRSRFRLVTGAGIGVALLGGVVLTRLGFADAATLINSLTQTVSGAGPVGWALFTLAQTAVAMAGVVPASLMGIAAGAVYGVWQGSLMAGVGTILGGLFAFMLARSLLRPWVERLLAARADGRLVGLEAAVMRDGWRFVCLLRISPIMPFAMTSYALGLTRIAELDYFLGTLAALPALVGYVAIGALTNHGIHAAASGTRTASVLHGASLGFGIAATAVLIFKGRTLLAKCGFLPGISALNEEPPG